jgi:hypothetical protein
MCLLFIIFVYAYFLCMFSHFLHTNYILYYLPLTTLGIALPKLVGHEPICGGSRKVFEI